MKRGPRPRGISREEARRRQRLAMADLRERRKQTWRCRQCPKPAKIHPETGRPMSACKKHLKADNARVKANYKPRKRG